MLVNGNCQSRRSMLTFSMAAFCCCRQKFLYGHSVLRNPSVSIKLCFPLHELEIPFSSKHNHTNKRQSWTCALTNIESFLVTFIQDHNIKSTHRVALAPFCFIFSNIYFKLIIYFRNNNNFSKS